MKRCHLIVLATVGIVLAFGWLALAPPEIPGYVVSDLQLISQESKPVWSEEWTGPIQAATILAWYAEHGYPSFMRDFNNDGVIDELDTIELADILGQVFMDTETVRGTTDVRLVLGLARYVAENYPGEFVLKIYDGGFSGEYSSEEGHSFDPSVIAGIELVLEDEPAIATYQLELESGEGVVVGLKQDDDNTYLSGRSFLYEKTPAGYTPIDLAWAEEDHWLSGNQGKVLETLGKMDRGFYLDFQSGWTLVEFMLALSPVEDPDGTSDPGECPEDAVAYDVMIADLGRYGSVQVDECVTRSDDVDTYTYTVTNIDFVYNGCGLCFFAVPKPMGLATLAHSEAVPWLYSVYPTAWTWRLPVGSCGIQPGESAVFSVSVPGPTIDTLVTGGIGTCVTISASGIYIRSEFFDVRTTGPGEPDESGACCFADGMCAELTVEECTSQGGVQFNPGVSCFDVECPPEEEEEDGACCFADGTCAELAVEECTSQGGTEFHPGVSCAVVQCPPPVEETCPDLIVEITSMICRNIGAAAPQYEVTIEALVTNIGSATVTDNIWVEVESDCGSDTDIIHTDLDPLESATAEFVLNCGMQGGCFDVIATVDYTHFIDECDEQNNEYEDRYCCRQ